MVDRDAWGDSYLTVESDILGLVKDAAVQSSLRPWAHNSHVPLQGSRQHKWPRATGHEVDATHITDHQNTALAAAAAAGAAAAISNTTPILLLLVRLVKA